MKVKLIILAIYAFALSPVIFADSVVHTYSWYNPTPHKFSGESHATVTVTLPYIYPFTNNPPNQDEIQIFNSVDPKAPTPISGSFQYKSQESDAQCTVTFNANYDGSSWSDEAVGNCSFDQNHILTFTK